MRPGGVFAATALGLVALFLAASPSALQAQTVQERLAVAKSLGWSVGDADAAITVVEFTDVSCPYCASFHGGTRTELQREFVDGGQVRWITLSYVSGLYPNSDALSVAAECAGRQGRYDDFLTAAYDDRESWLRSSNADAISAAERFAKDIGLDDEAFASCRRDAEIVERLLTVASLAREVGVRGTPTWFVEGFLVMGDLPFGYARQFIATRLPGQ